MSVPPCSDIYKPCYLAEIPLLGMRSSADRPLSALLAIVSTVLILGLLTFLIGKLAPDEGLSARAESETTASE